MNPYDAPQTPKNNTLPPVKSGPSRLFYTLVGILVAIMLSFIMIVLANQKKAVPLKTTPASAPVSPVAQPMAAP